MSKKQLNTNAISNELEGGASLFFTKSPIEVTSNKPQKQNKSTRETTPQITQNIETPRERSSESPREYSRALPSRDDIQEFSFRLRDELKVKVQAEVPHQWQERLEETARELKVKKLELYRYIFGEFLGEVHHKQ